MDKVSLTKQEYVALKKLTKGEVEVYLTQVCHRSYNEGVECISKVFLTRVEEALNMTSGIGQARSKAFIDNLIKVMNREEREYEEYQTSFS